MKLGHWILYAILIIMLARIGSELRQIKYMVNEVICTALEMEE